MGLYYYQNDTKKQLRKAKRDDICSDILNKLKDWNDADLAQSRDDYVNIAKEIFPSYKRNKQDVKKIPDVYEQYKTYTSAIYKGVFQNYDSMIDIEGLDKRSNDIASIYKASLVYDFNNMQLKKTLLKVLDDWTLKGEGAVFIHWDKEIESIPQMVIDPETGEPKRIMAPNVIRDGLNIKRIDPHNLFYDKSQKDNWQVCGKIYRDFAPIQYVLSNKLYNLTQDERKQLMEMVSSKSDNVGDSKSSMDKRTFGNTVEILEYRGDYIIPNTTDIVRNVEIVIVAGKFLAMIKESEYPKCPIVYDCYLSRPDTLRGQGPLKPAYILSEVENMCMDLQMEAWKLSVNPVFIAPKGAFEANAKLVAGKPLYYDPHILGAGTLPMKLDTSAGIRGFEFQQFFKDKIEGATGISKYLQGSQQGAVRTASESTYINQGATMRLSMECALFSGLVLKMVETYATFKKYYEDTDYEVPVNISGQKVFAKVNDEVRKGNYCFIMGGSQSSVERDAETAKLMQLLQSPVFQSLSQIMDKETAGEFLKWVLNRENFRGAEQIFEMMSLHSMIEKTGLEQGVTPANLSEYSNDVKQVMKQTIPDIGLGLAGLSGEGEGQEELEEEQQEALR